MIAPFEIERLPDLERPQHHCEVRSGDRLDLKSPEVHVQRSSSENPRHDADRTKHGTAVLRMTAAAAPLANRR